MLFRLAPLCALVALVGCASSDSLARLDVALQPAGASSALTVPPAEFLAACHASMRKASAEIAQVKALPPASTGEVVIGAFDAAYQTMADTDARAGLADQVHPDKAMRNAAESCEQEISVMETAFWLDRGIYDALAHVDVHRLDPASRYYIKRSLQRFKLAGVDRDEATRARVKQLEEELVKLSQQFNRTIREDVRTLEVDRNDLVGLPADFLKAHAPGADGKVRLKTDNPDYIPVMTYARDEAVRERFWKLYRVRAEGNLPVLEQMLAKRAEIAHLLGFANWADYITADKMIGTGGNAASFIGKISKAADARAHRDYEDLLARKRIEQPGASAVQAWDSGYLTDRIKAERFGVDMQQVRPYFQYDNVKRGVFATTSKLFGVQFRPVIDAKVWHPDVEVYDVMEGDRVLGRIYLDMYPREAKYKHYAHFGLLHGKEGAALPEGVLVCNFRKPTADDPGLLEYSDVVTFFHEFGHLMHNVLGGHTRWAGTSGVATERDFVEAPSQMLEEWARNPKVLQTFAVHYKTGQPISSELASKLERANDYGRGLFVRQQMFYAATSLELHRRDPKGLDTTQVVAQLQEEYTPFKFVPGTRFQASFGHLDGYSAVYYTYMWSLVIAKDMFSQFEGDMMNPAIAARYRHAVLEPGGSKPAADLVRDFIGRPYGFESYEKWLNRD